MSSDKKNKVIRTIPGIQRRTVDLIRMGNDKVKIINKISKSFDENLIPRNILEDVVNDVCDSYPNYKLIQKIMRSKIVNDIESDDKKYYLVDEDRKEISKISIDNLKNMFSRHFPLSQKVYTAVLKYKPTQKGILAATEDGPWTFNTYIPPSWYEDYFYSRGELELPEQNTIPEEYSKFLNHLVDGDEDSYNYILDWLSTALRGRNHCMLCTIGAKGIGKGVLGEIMTRLVGKHNFTLTDNKVFKSNFNAQVKDKKIIYIDEVTITNTQEEDKLKLLINNNLEIEQKGVDAKPVVNYGNVYLSSNNLDAIKLSGDNRRFSVVNLTDVKLSLKFKSSEIENLFKNKELVAKLACYLWRRPVDKDKMLQVFESARTQEVRLSGLKDWQYWLLFEYAPKLEKRTMKVEDLSNVIIDNNAGIRTIGHRALKNLQNLYPEKIKVHRPRVKGDTARPFMVDFL